MRLLALSLVCGTFVCVPARAGADDDSTEKAQARTLLSQGNALFEKGDLKGALVDFRAAYSLYPSAKLLVNAAAAERELGDLPSAANDLRHFVDEAPADDPQLIDKAQQDLKALERKVGRITLAGWPAKSVIDVDGRPGRDPTYVRPGEHHVRARTPDGAELEKDITVGAGESVDVPQPPPGTVSARVATAHPAAPAPRRWWIGVVIGSVALVAVGVGLGVGLTVGSNPQPLKGDLGIFKFSDFK